MTTSTSASSSGTETHARADFRSLVYTAWSEFRGVAEAENRRDLISELEPEIKRLELGIFRLVVMGEIKKGKSSFINALLVEPGLLPTATDVATSTVFKIIYGPEKKFKVFFLPDEDTSKSRSPLEIDAKGLSEYGTEDENPDNKKRVDFIGIELPHPFLKEGLVIVDTPGVGGLIKKHRDITWRYAPNADAVCFVVDSAESVISQDELTFLKDLTSKMTKQVFFVQTKTDIAGTDQTEAWEKRNKSLLAETLGFESSSLAYFPISSERKNLADKKRLDPQVRQEDLMRHFERSGFGKVTEYLNQGLIKRKEALLAQRVAQQLVSACSDQDRELTGKARILRARSKEELDAINNQLIDSQKAIETWERTVYRKEMQNFSDAYAELKLRTTNELQQKLDPTGSIFTSIIDPLRSTEFDPATANQLAGQIQQECLDRASHVVLNTQSNFNRQALAMISETAGHLAKGFLTVEDTRLSQVSMSGPVKIEDSLHLEFNTFDHVRTALYGGMAGATIASVGIGILSVVFPPAGAVALFATVLGGWFGGQEAARIQKQKDRQQVIQALSGLLSQTINKAATQARNQFTEHALLLERKARDTFQQATERAKAELQERIKEVQAARSTSQSEANSKMEDVERKLQKLQSIKDSLKSILPETRTA